MFLILCHGQSLCLRRTPPSGLCGRGAYRARLARPEQPRLAFSCPPPPALGRPSEAGRILIRAPRQVRPPRRIGTLGCFVDPVPFPSPPPPLPFALSVRLPLCPSAFPFHSSSSHRVTPSPPPALQLGARPTALRLTADRHRRRGRSRRRAVRLWLPRPAACRRRREPVPPPPGGGQCQRVVNRPPSGTATADAATVAVTFCRGRPLSTRPRQRRRCPHGAAHSSRHRHASLNRKAARPSPPECAVTHGRGSLNTPHRLSGRRSPAVRKTYRPLPAFQDSGGRQRAVAPPRRWAHAERPARRR